MRCAQFIDVRLRMINRNKLNGLAIAGLSLHYLASVSEAERHAQSQ
jgi:hypothetical protein